VVVRGASAASDLSFRSSQSTRALQLLRRSRSNPSVAEGELDVSIAKENLTGSVVRLSHPFALCVASAPASWPCGSGLGALRAFVTEL